MNSMYSYSSSHWYVPTLRAWITFSWSSFGWAAWAWWWNLGYGWYGWSTCTWALWNNTLWNTKWWDGWWWALGWSGTNWHWWWWWWLRCSWWGGGTWWNSDTNPYRLGSWGWAGSITTDDFSSWYGWNGWGMIRISSNTLYLSGKLLANGQDWWNITPDSTPNRTPILWAWGGWWGGSILIRAKALNCNTWNSIEVKWWNWWTWFNTFAWGWGGWWVITYYYTEKKRYLCLSSY